MGWCGDCDKCRFVFLVFATFMPRERVVAIIGKDMLDDASQLPGYRALLGLGAHKPFECVGEEAECSVAMSIVSRTGDWADSAVVAALLEEIPTLREGSADLEHHVLRRAEADPLPEPTNGPAVRLSDLDGRRVLVLGTGREGSAVAEALSLRGIAVTAVDDRESEGSARFAERWGRCSSRPTSARWRAASM